MYPARLDEEYLEMKVLTASPQQLHLMVLEAAIRHARQARQALEQSDRENSHLLLNRSREFVTELIGGLNPEQSPEMVLSLQQLFAFAYRNLVMADLEGNPARIDDALRILELHRETWLELIQIFPTTQNLETSSGTVDWQG
ncbi:MAG: flagellar export chaperone FliS [Planctomycetaceae bacterium]|nr:flagellar export chaperone FliS [Planctomycetaceae bacterium]